MAKKLTIQLPIYQTFKALMTLEKNQDHKGIEANSYLLLLNTLQSGYFLNSFSELLFLCEKIWLKPFHTNTHPVNKTVLCDLLIKNLKEYNTEIISPTDIKKKKKTPINPTDIPVINPTPTPNTQSQPEPFVLNNTQINTPKTDLYLSITNDDNNTTAITAKQNASNLFNQNNYTLNYKHLPVSPRFLEQTFRSLRYKAKGRGKKTIDFEGTINQIAAQGYFTNWAYKKTDTFITQWTLFLDHEGSMIAFEDLLKAIPIAAFEGSMINKGEIYFYKNYPVNFLYTNEQHTKSITFNEFANGPQQNILIISDAGAARGWYNQDRVLKTYTMLYKLRKHRIAWLNPMPKNRWANTSAASIANFVNMFELGTNITDGLGNIVRSLKSKIV